MKSSLEGIVEIFAKMESNGFNTAGELKWGFYFADGSIDVLENIYTELIEKDYRKEGIRKISEGEYLLHVSKIDILTPEKLHRRNLAFNELAAYFSAASYDGWDVERIK